MKKGSEKNDLFRRIYLMVGPSSDGFSSGGSFIVRKLLRKFSVPVLVVFWSFTWHAYALGAIDQKDPAPETQKAGFKQQSSQGKLLSTIQNKVQFKRRPFIAKGDVTIANPFLLNEPLSFVEYNIRIKFFTSQNPSKINYFLRAPPSLI